MIKELLLIYIIFLISSIGVNDEDNNKKRISKKY